MSTLLLIIIGLSAFVASIAFLGVIVALLGAPLALTAGQFFLIGLAAVVVRVVTTWIFAATA